MEMARCKGNDSCSVYHGYEMPDLSDREAGNVSSRARMAFAATLSATRQAKYPLTIVASSLPFEILGERQFRKTARPYDQASAIAIRESRGTM